MTLGETIIERHKTIEVRILEVDIEIIITEMTTLEEVEIGLRNDNIQVILEGMTRSSRGRSRSGPRAQY